MSLKKGLLQLKVWPPNELKGPGAGGVIAFTALTAMAGVLLMDRKTNTEYIPFVHPNPGSAVKI